MTPTQTVPDAPAEVAAAELPVPEELSRHRLTRRIAIVVALILIVVAAITLLPGLTSLRARFSHARPGWLALGIAFKVLSGLGYVAIFRAVFCKRMSWRVSWQIGMSELGANALVPTGGAGGLALGVWALRRGGVPTEHIARRTVAFFLLTSLANVGALIVVGSGMALGILPGHASLSLTLIPVAAAVLGIVGALAAGRFAARVQQRLLRGEATPAARRVARILGTLAEGVHEAVALLREGNVWLLAGSAAYLAFDVMILWGTFHAFGAAPPLAIIWIAYLIGELGGIIPVPGGIGGIDAGLVGTLVLYGVHVGAATAAVLAYRAIALWVPATLGSVAFLMLRRTLHDEARAIAECMPQTEMEVIGRGRVRIVHRRSRASPPTRR